MPRKAFLVVVGMTAFGTCGLPMAVAQPAADPLFADFESPPSSARPRVWWHWMNGNITKDGIDKDIAWMSRVGIGGMQNFDASLVTPQVVDERLVYMSTEWKDAFRFAAKRAQEEGLELGIAGSPGWSETGGPWVPPEDGIKKIVWSETYVKGGRHFVGRLNAPPTVTGAFQTMRVGGTLGLAYEGGLPPESYRDIAVLAVPDEAPEGAQNPDVRDGQGRKVDAAILSDGEYDATIDVGAGTPLQPVSLELTYSEPREFRAATLFMRDTGPTFFDPYFSPSLEAHIDGEWHRIATFDTRPVPTTVAFAPVHTSKLRVVFDHYTGPRRPAQASPVPGVITPDFIADARHLPVAKVAELRVSSRPRIDRFETKAGFVLTNDYQSLLTSAPSDETGVGVGRVIDLTDRFRPDGSLDWKPPKGNWRVLRLGWTLTGKTNHPAPSEATGLEVDKLDGDAVERYLRHYLDMYRSVVGEDLFGEEGLQVLLTDSTEVGGFNWTPRMIEHFHELRGYDPTPWLPTLTGIVIGSRADSDRFLYDFRLTLAELHAEEHYATVARVAHEYGLKVYGEALEDQRPVVGDDMALRRYADVPMAALWTWTDDDGPRQTLLGDMKGASSVGHLYGKNIVAAESLTSALAPWAHAPSDLRRVVDLEFAHGINRIVIHTSVHQPLDELQPGLSLMIFGQFFNRHETWAEMAKPWLDYLARSAFLLQQGKDVADVAYFYGEDSPLSAITAFGPPEDVPKRYAFDYVNADVLSETLSVKDGDLVAPSGARYRVLYLGPGAAGMTLPTLRRIAALAQKGATVVGTAPTASPSLADDPEEFASLVGQLWRGETVTEVGEGLVIDTRDVELALEWIGAIPDVQVNQASAAEDVMFVHRQLDDGDLYYLVNRAKHEVSLDVRFRVFGKAPDFWNADTGSVVAASYRQEDSGTAVPIALGPEESIFVVFRRDATSEGLTVSTPTLAPILALNRGWKISFEAGRGAPESIEVDTLNALSDHANPGIRYFSGVSTYTTQFTLPENIEPGQPLWLDLGKVGDLAEVLINGKVGGSVWHAPFRMEIGAAVQHGANKLEIRVANLWVNRLIGDAQPGAEKIASTTIPTFAPDAPLRPSGLIGPVNVLAVSETERHQ